MFHLVHHHSDGFGTAKRHGTRWFTVEHALANSVLFQAGARVSGPCSLGVRVYSVQGACSAPFPTWARTLSELFARTPTAGTVSGQCHYPNPKQHSSLPFARFAYPTHGHPLQPSVWSCDLPYSYAENVPLNRKLASSSRLLIIKTFKLLKNI